MRATVIPGPWARPSFHPCGTPSRKGEAGPPLKGWWNHRPDSSPVSSWNQTTPVASYVGAPSVMPMGWSVTRRRWPVERSSAWICHTPDSLEAKVNRSGAPGDHSGRVTEGALKRCSQCGCSSGTAAEPNRPSPVLPMHDFVEQSSVRTHKRSKWPVRRIAKRDEEGAGSIRGMFQDRPSLVLVANRRVATTDPEVSGHHHHAHRRLAEIELDQLSHVWVVRLRDDDGDRRCGIRHVPGPSPHGRELAEPVAFGH